MLTARARRIDSRVIALVAAILAVALLVGAVVVYLRSTSNNARALCAQLPDSAGLYAGNAVNIRGVKVGTVTSLNPENGYVTVHMKVDDRRLASDLKVVAINNSVLADRRLELVGTDARGGPELAAQTCVPLSRTFTPISVSDAFQSFTTMFNEVGGVGTDTKKPVGELISVTSREINGSGGDINKSIKNMSSLMAAPDEFLAQMRSIFDNLATLTDVTTQNWDDLRDIGTNSASLTFMMGRLIEDFVYIFNGLSEAAPAIDDLLGDLLPPLLDTADVAKPLIDLGIAKTPDLLVLLREIPGIATSASAMMSRSARGVPVSVSGPKVLTRTPSSAALCGLLDRSGAGHCDVRTGQTAVVDLTGLVGAAIAGGLGR
ncbi:MULTISPECIES: MlaD family protein [unclassified Gordonia (in: high G+C Gram-positive bacteria)]|uniref:MlaD family protein n=1 Tax=unclassified Gordonia (in: high G+C Gram-positive bacteria) TaxID=2657482 RepID=UPI0007EC1579|nr:MULTISPECIES: MlaD family protein [unclassified Gordonia (in: high G+C Gram-positive bacteria)]OBC05461.1 mammalian cell entry protein [Gordonia sp. 852002-50395_SCH5434458]OBC14023.1 mammalian cell entry protein [Gordonia sp. 852002-50816_SCH5313054-a]OBC19611.1 mammalian cell entry protein [Gordonia sp. 852002-50816_SCH5313054-c]